MKTYEMLALADENEKPYKCGDMYYQKDKGFTRRDGVSAFDEKDGNTDIKFVVHKNNNDKTPIIIDITDIDDIDTSYDVDY